MPAPVLRTTVIQKTEVDPSGAAVVGLAIKATLKSSASAAVLVYKNASNLSDPANKTLINSALAPKTTSDASGLWQLSLVAPGDIAGLNPNGTYASVVVWYEITRGTVTTKTTAFAYSGTALDFSTLFASAPTPGLTTVAMTLDGETAAAIADPGETITARLSQDCDVLADDAVTTVHLYSTTPITATTDANGHAVLNVVPSSRLPDGVFYYVTLRIGGDLLSFNAPDGGGRILDHLVAPIPVGTTTLGAATRTTLGLVKVGSHLTIDGSGRLHVIPVGAQPTLGPFATWL
jgi:hypothetical protein